MEKNNRKNMDSNNILFNEVLSPITDNENTDKIYVEDVFDKETKYFNPSAWID